MNSANVIIIGGGAAGMMAAAKLGNTGARVVLMEKRERFGRKLLITGKGRCNLTNMRPWNEFQQHIHPDASFLKNSFYAFSNEGLVHFFQEAGLATKVERGERVFPESDRSLDVLDALMDVVERGGVACLPEHAVEDLHRREADGKFELKVLTPSGETRWEADHVVVATGGLSYPMTGSTGDGHRWAESLQHPMVPCFPAITALKPQHYDENLEGILLTNVRVDLWVGGNLVQQEEGEFSFTELGMEGGVAFRVSRKAVRALLNKEKVWVSVDLKPNLTEDQLFARIRREKAAQPKIQMRELLRKMMPKQLVYPFYAAHPGLKEEHLPRALKNWKFPIAEYGSYNRAVVTAGGVSLKAVSRKTLESKSVPGLYFIGEVLDLDGDTGGYNLQIAFSTAATAAAALRKKLTDL